MQTKLKFTFSTKPISEISKLFLKPNSNLIFKIKVLAILKSLKFDFKKTFTIPVNARVFNKIYTFFYKNQLILDWGLPTSNFHTFLTSFVFNLFLNFIEK